MQYDIDQLADIQTIKITVNATLSHELRKAIHLKVVSLLTLTGFNRLLIDVRNSILAEDYSEGQSIDMVNYMQCFSSCNETIIAFLCTDENGQRKKFVDLAKLSGIIIEHFADEDQAIDWLCSISV